MKHLIQHGSHKNSSQFTEIVSSFIIPMLYANSLAANATMPHKDAMLSMTEVGSVYSGLALRVHGTDLFT